MKVYRLKHIPTGWYYCPSRFIKAVYHGEDRWYCWVKSNLSKKGKIYTNKPSLEYLKSGGFTSHLVEFPKEHHYIEEDWEIEEL